MVGSCAELSSGDIFRQVAIIQCDALLVAVRCEGLGTGTVVVLSSCRASAPDNNQSGSNEEQEDAELPLFSLNLEGECRKSLCT